MHDFLELCERVASPGSHTAEHVCFSCLARISWGLWGGCSLWRPAGAPALFTLAIPKLRSCCSAETAYEQQLGNLGMARVKRAEEQERERERTGPRLILELLLPSATELLWGDWAPPGPLARWAMKAVARSRQFLLLFRVHAHHSQHPAMTRPGLEPGISGSGGRRLIH